MRASGKRTTQRITGLLLKYLIVIILAAPYAFPLY